jgi:hypothetical protein
MKYMLGIVLTLILDLLALLFSLQSVNSIVQTSYPLPITQLFYDATGPHLTIFLLVIIVTRILSTTWHLTHHCFADDCTGGSGYNSVDCVITSVLRTCAGPCVPRSYGLHGKESRRCAVGRCLAIRRSWLRVVCMLRRLSRCFQCCAECCSDLCPPCIVRTARFFATTY